MKKNLWVYCESQKKREEKNKEGGPEGKRGGREGQEEESGMKKKGK